MQAPAHAKSLLSMAHQSAWSLTRRSFQSADVCHRSASQGWLNYKGAKGPDTSFHSDKQTVTLSLITELCKNAFVFTHVTGHTIGSFHDKTA